MTIYSLYIISKSGGLIYSYDPPQTATEIEKTFSYPLDLKLDYINQRVVVTFGQRDGIRGVAPAQVYALLTTVCVRAVGYSVLAINGEPISGRKVGERDVLNDILANEASYPVSIKYVATRSDHLSFTTRA